jgi:hypothetical protein
MKKSWPFLMIFLILVLFIQACSCLSFIWGSNTVSIYFLAEKKINGGLLLPVDIIVVNDSTGNEIVKTDPDKWFVSDKRKTLVRGKEIFQLAIKGGEFRKDTQIHINEHIKKIIIYANYNKQSSRESQQYSYHHL